MANFSHSGGPRGCCLVVVRTRAAQPVAVVRQHANARANFRHPGTARTRSYGVDVPATQLERHGWDIHAVSAEPRRTMARDHRSRECSRNSGAPGVAAGATRRGPRRRPPIAAAGPRAPPAASQPVAARRLPSAASQSPPAGHRLPSAGWPPAGRPRRPRSTWAMQPWARTTSKSPCRGRRGEPGGAGGSELWSAGGVSFGG